jgi:SAM-dependent methyltransferase
VTRTTLHRVCAITVLSMTATLLLYESAFAQRPVEPSVGQPGKDAVWVPTSADMVEKMLDMAKVTARDFVVDLGSGDGRNVIAAAKRGARALGVEYNADLVELSRQRAREAGVSDKASFLQGDMFEADISDATVLPLFLLPQNLERLRDKFLALRPGTRIVLNTYGIPGWQPDESETIQGDCSNWCTSLLHIVPAQVAGTWLLPFGKLTLSQDVQMLAGTLSSADRSTPLDSGRLRGDEISFTVAGVNYTGRVSGDVMEVSTSSNGAPRAWTATRAR